MNSGDQLLVEGLAGGAARQPFRGAIPQQDAQLRVDENDAVVHAIEQLLVKQFVDDLTVQHVVQARHRPSPQIVRLVGIQLVKPAPRDLGGHPNPIGRQ